MVDIFQSLIGVFQSLHPVTLLMIEALFCFSIILLLLTLFGSIGLFIYTAVAIIAANIQVLKIVDFDFFSHPIALGTILFSSTYLCTDILAEYYHEKLARLCIYIGFVTFGLWVVLMLLTIGYPADALSFQEDGAMRTLFMPVPALFIAGMTAYLISQLHDVWVFQFIRRLTGGRFLWLRNCLSTILSSLIDNAIFTILAFVVLASSPLPWDVVIYSYILGSFLFRVVMALADTPFVYMARNAIKLHERYFATKMSYSSSYTSL